MPVQRPLCHGEVCLVPQTDVRHLPGDDLLDFTKEPLALGDVGRDGRLVQQPIYACVRKIAAIESRRRRLPGVEDAPKDVGIGDRASRPLQDEHLKVSLQDVCVERRELVGADVERDADVAQVLLDDRRLQTVEFEFDIFSDSANRGRGPSPSGSAIASLVEQRPALAPDRT